MYIKIESFVINGDDRLKGHSAIKFQPFSVYIVTKEYKKHKEQARIRSFNYLLIIYKLLHTLLQIHINSCLFSLLFNTELLCFKQKREPLFIL